MVKVYLEPKADTPYFLNMQLCSRFYLYSSAQPTLSSSSGV